MQLPRFLRLHFARKLAKSPAFLKIVESNSNGNIPIFIIAFNNGVYVRNMVGQLNGYNLRPIVLNNCSTDIKTIQILNDLESAEKITLINCPINFGHKVLFLDPIYKKLPEIFACTDPDLQFGANMPKDFLNKLLQLTHEYQVFKAGLALSLEMPMQTMVTKVRIRYPLQFSKTYTIKEWEKKFWTRRLQSKENLIVFNAAVDTTFFVANKKYFDGNLFDGVRVAGDFSCVHLPWHPDLDITSERDKKIYARSILSKTSMWMH